MALRVGVRGWIEMRFSTITDKITLLSIFLFLQYVFWFQYAVGEIDWFLTVVGLVMILCIFLRGKLNLDIVKKSAFVFVYMFSILLSCLLFPLNRSISMDYYSRILRYLIPFIAICLYVGTSYERAKLIYLSLCVSGFFLSISLFLTGEYNLLLGGVAMGDLNPNVFSSYALAGLLGSLSLLNCTNKKSLRVLLIISIIIDSKAQVQAGSRRGILVFILVLLLYLFAATILKYKKNDIAKLLMAIVGIVAVFIIIFDFSIIVPGYNNLSQLLSIRTAGDYNRSMYQKVALELFLQQPIFGNGLGSVGQVAGVYSHSLYFENLACNGVVGLLLLTIPLLNIIRSSRKAIKQNFLSTEIKMQNGTLIITVLALLITGIAVAFIYDAIFYLFLAFIVSSRSATANYTFEKEQE